MTAKIRIIQISLISILGCTWFGAWAEPLSSAFTYQGQQKIADCFTVTINPA